MVLLLISVTATVPGMPAQGQDQHQECAGGRCCLGHSCCWHCSGFPGGRSNTAPAASVVVIPIIRIIKMIFFCMGGSWLPLESDSIQPLLASCSLLGEKDMGEEGCLPFLQIHSPALEHSQGA